MGFERLKSRGTGSLLCMAAALVALVTAIVFFATHEGAVPVGHGGIMPGLALVAGVVVAVVLWLVPVRFGAIVQAAIYGAALYLSITQLYLVFADVINQVTYAGGNPALCIFYMAGAFVSCLLCVIACAFEQPVAEEVRQASKRMRPVAAALVVALVAGLGVNAFGGGFLSGGGAGSAENVKISASENEFSGKTIDELVATPRADWVAKEAAGDVVYFFEGQYTEGFATSIDPASFDMYLCKDGSMYGSVSGPETSPSVGITYLYGYWYNVDDAGEDIFVVHLTGILLPNGMARATDVENGEDADIHIFDTDHGDYNWTASFCYGFQGGGGLYVWTRNINIYGQAYTPAQSLAIDASALPTFYTGDDLDPAPLSVTTVRGSGSEERIWGGRLNLHGYDPQQVGTQTITATFLGAQATFEVDVEELVADTYTGTYGMVELGAYAIPVSDQTTDLAVSVIVDYSHKTVTIAADDGSIIETGELIDAHDGSLTMTMNGSEPFEATISDNTLIIPAHQEVVSSFGGTNTYDLGEYAFTLT